MLFMCPTWSTKIRQRSKGPRHSRSNGKPRHRMACLLHSSLIHSVCLLMRHKKRNNACGKIPNAILVMLDSAAQPSLKPYNISVLRFYSVPIVRQKLLSRSSRSSRGSPRRLTPRTHQSIVLVMSCVCLLSSTRSCRIRTRQPQPSSR